MKKINMSSISNKIKFIYGDECEKNTVGIVIFSNGIDYFFDEKFNNKMSNEEVEALLLRGAVISKGGKYYRPASFDNENVSFSDAAVNPKDITNSRYQLKYYQDFLNHINENTPNNKIVFGIQTDTHYSINANYIENNFYNLVNLTKIIDFNFVCNLGDMVDGNSTVLTSKSDIKRALDIYKNINNTDFLYIKGNHDNNTYYTYTNTKNRSIKEIIEKEWFYENINLQCSHLNNVVVDKNVNYYFKDYGKVRVICLDTQDLPEATVNANGQLIFGSIYNAGIDQDQIDWLITALSVPSDYSVVILSHHSLADGEAYGNDNVHNANVVRGILEAFKNGSSYSITNKPIDNTYMVVSVNCDFSSYGRHDVIGNFAGHCHCDKTNIINGITYIQTDSSMYNSSKNKDERNMNDHTSDVIDIPIVDLDNKQVTIYRFGYGFNTFGDTTHKRTFYYI